MSFPLELQLVLSTKSITCFLDFVEALRLCRTDPSPRTTPTPSTVPLHVIAAGVISYHLILLHSHSFNHTLILGPPISIWTSRGDERNRGAIRTHKPRASPFEIWFFTSYPLPRTLLCQHNCTSPYL
jgi:hypothetical protein